MDLAPGGFQPFFLTPQPSTTFPFFLPPFRLIPELENTLRKLGRIPSAGGSPIHRSGDFVAQYLLPPSSFPSLASVQDPTYIASRMVVPAGLRFPDPFLDQFTNLISMIGPWASAEYESGDCSAACETPNFRHPPLGYLPYACAVGLQCFPGPDLHIASCSATFSSSAVW